MSATSPTPATTVRAQINAGDIGGIFAGLPVTAMDDIITSILHVASPGSVGDRVLLQSMQPVGMPDSFVSLASRDWDTVEVIALTSLQTCISPAWAGVFQCILEARTATVLHSDPIGSTVVEEAIRSMEVDLRLENVPSFCASLGATASGAILIPGFVVVCAGINFDDASSDRMLLETAAAISFPPVMEKPNRTAALAAYWRAFLPHFAVAVDVPAAGLPAALVSPAGAVVAPPAALVPAAVVVVAPPVIVMGPPLTFDLTAPAPAPAPAPQPAPAGGSGGAGFGSASAPPLQVIQDETESSDDEAGRVSASGSEREGDRDSGSGSESASDSDVETETDKGAKTPDMLLEATQAAKAVSRLAKMRSASRLADARAQIKLRSVSYMAGHLRRTTRHVEAAERLSVAQAKLTVTKQRNAEAVTDLTFCQERVKRLKSEIASLGHRVKMLSIENSDAEKASHESYMKVQYSVRELAAATVGPPKCKSRYNKVLAWLFK
jgi:hypothetical protein